MECYVVFEYYGQECFCLIVCELCMRMKQLLVDSAQAVVHHFFQAKRNRGEMLAMSMALNGKASKPGARSETAVESSIDDKQKIAVTCSW